MPSDLEPEGLPRLQKRRKCGMSRPTTAEAADRRRRASTSPKLCAIVIIADQDRPHVNQRQLHPA